MSQPIESTYLRVSFLMRPSSPFLPCLSHPPQHHLCIHLLLCLANLKMLHIRLCCYLIMVQELDVELAWNSSLIDPLHCLWCTSIGQCMHRLLPSTLHRAPRLQPRLGRSPCWLLRPVQSLRRPPLSSLRRHLPSIVALAIHAGVLGAYFARVYSGSHAAGAYVAWSAVARPAVTWSFFAGVP